MNRSTLILFGTISGLLATTTCATQFDNQNFENGTLAGWAYSYSGPSPDVSFAQAVDSSFGVPPLQGDYSALLVTRDTSSGSVDCSTDAWHIDCPIPISFTSAEESTPPPNVFDPGITYAARLSQAVTVRGGDVISFDFQFFGETGADAFWAALAPVDNHDTIVCGVINYYIPDRHCYFSSPYATFITPDAPTLVGIATGTPVADFLSINDVYSWNFRVPYDGTWNLTVGVGSNVDSLYSSAVLIDDFHILPQQAPEPGTLFLLAAALTAVPAMRRRRNPSRTA